MYKAFLLNILIIGQAMCLESKAQVQTLDVRNFWIAYDSLINCKIKKDSIDCIDRYYTTQGTKALKKYLKTYRLKAEDYLNVIQSAPQFWKSIRHNTEKIYTLENSIQSLLEKYQTILPSFKKPRITFIIGCLNSGGTVNKNNVIIGSEIACADRETNSNELNQNLKNVFNRDFAIQDYVAHEIIHTQQKGIPFFEFFKLIKYRRLSLENICILEGSCDFITQHFLNLNINKSVHHFANDKRGILIAQFNKDVELSPFDYTNWLYNSANTKIIQPDLGYYIGFLATQEYFLHAQNKTKALKTILKRNRYKTIIKCLK